jgi:hypothetical protein
MSNFTQEEIDQLAAAVAQRLEPGSVPLCEQLWDLAMVARYLHRNAQTVRESMACLPSFPKAIRLPSEGRAHPLYNAGEVIAWAKKFRDKN